MTYPMSYPAGEELIEGYCRNCGHREKRPPEELEPGAECPNCHEPQFGGPLEEGEEVEETEEEEGDSA